VPWKSGQPTLPDATRPVIILYEKKITPFELAIAQSLARSPSGSVIYPSRCHA